MIKLIISVAILFISIILCVIGYNNMPKKPKNYIPNIGDRFLIGQLDRNRNINSYGIGVVNITYSDPTIVMFTFTDKEDNKRSYSLSVEDFNREFTGDLYKFYDDDAENCK